MKTEDTEALRRQRAKPVDIIINPYCMFIVDCQTDKIE